MDKKSTGQRWDEFRPSKTMWFWSCVSCVIATIIVGFWFGGWVTGGSARDMASDAADQARARLVADVCVERFSQSPDFGAQLASLKDTSSYQRDDIIEEGGWVTLAGMEKPLADAADLCAERLVTMEAPAQAAAVAEPATSIE